MYVYLCVCMYVCMCVCMSSQKMFVRNFFVRKSCLLSFCFLLEILFWSKIVFAENYVRSENLFSTKNAQFENFLWSKILLVTFFSAGHFQPKISIVEIFFWTEVCFYSKVVLFGKFIRSNIFFLKIYLVVKVCSIILFVENCFLVKLFLVEDFFVQVEIFSLLQNVLFKNFSCRKILLLEIILV